jgi:dihydroorotase
MALAYKSRLEKLEPKVKFLMTLYLSPELTVEEVKKAKEAGIVGVKSYPKFNILSLTYLRLRGVTTNSDSGVLSYEQYYPVFKAMEEHDLILNLHGEVPPAPPQEQDIAQQNATTVLTAEQSFLPTLLDLHQRFPNLRIILEHCTTAAAVEAVLSCGPTVAGTITAHHLYLTVDSWAGDPFNFCKPVAKLPSDRLALINAASSGNPKFFLGSDSAPHPQSSKIAKKAAAGVFTQPYVMHYVTEVFDRAGKLNKLKGFCAEFGRAFYRVEASGKEGKIVMVKRGVTIKDLVGGAEGIVPFRAGETLAWDVIWIDP